MRRALILSSLAVAATFAASAPAHAAVAFAPCPGASGKGLECGTLTVPLDRSAKVPGTLALRVRRVAGSTGTEAVLRLGGGPGEASLPALKPFAATFAKQLAGRQVVAIDTRGTGAGAIRCSGTGTTAAAARACAARVGARLAFLSTDATAADLEQLRTELGATKLSIVATSYGGRVANEYARDFPQSVGSLVLDSPTALTGTDPFARDRSTALPRVLSDICAGGACRGITPSLRADLAADVRLAARGRLRVTVAGRSRRVPVAALYTLVITSDLSPFGRAGLPAALRAARQGDTALLGRLLGASTSSSDEIIADPGVLSVGTLLAVSCQESPLPWDPASAPGTARLDAARKAIAALPDALYAPFTKELAVGTGTIPLCVSWPSVAPAPASTAPAPDVPVLTLVGTQDLRTPVETARRLTGEFPRGQVVEIPGAGHAPLASDLTGCAERAVAAFLTTGTAPQCRSARRAPAPFTAPPRTVRGADPIAGIPGDTGQATSAALATVDDLVEVVATADVLSGRIAGLRGGTATLRAPRVTLRAYSAVRGLRLDGSLRLSAATLAPSGTIRVTSAQGSGTLRISGRRVSGTIGGRKLTVRRLVASPIAASLAGVTTSRSTLGLTGTAPLL